MSLQVVAVPNGRWKQNCYLAVDASAGEALLVDPGSDAEAIEAALATTGSRPVGIVNTHAHYDHVGAVDALMQHHGLPFLLHPADAKLLTQANLYKILFESRQSVTVPKPTRWLPAEGGSIELGGFQIEVIATPGHTPGSVVLRVDDELFSGDTLLPKGPGRTDLPGGDRVALARSVEALRALPGHLTVHPGHGSAFGLGEWWARIDAAPAAES